MSSNRLQSNNTSVEVWICDWHMRRIFWDEEFISKVKAGELAIVYGPLKPRRNPAVQNPAPYNQEFVIYDPQSGNEVVRCHVFVEADQTTYAASGYPDPKQIVVGGFDYHLIGAAGQSCPHCAQGLSTHPVKPRVSL